VKPDRQDAVLCRLYDAQKALSAAKRLARYGRLAESREAIMAVQRMAWEAKQASSSRIMVTGRVVIETWMARHDENGYGHDHCVTLTEYTYGVMNPRGMLVTGWFAVNRELKRIFGL